MANLFDWNAVEGKINTVLASYADLNRTKALTSLFLAELLSLDFDDAVDAITDKGRDHGVDALYIDDSENHFHIHIFQTKCVGTFEKSKNNFPGGEIDKIASFITDLTNHDLEALSSANDLLRPKINDALAVLKESAARIFVHFVGNMAPLTSEEMNRIEAKFSRYRAIEFLMHDLDAISEFFLEKNAPNLVREITAIDANFFDRSDQNLRGMVCTVAATDIVNMIASDDDPTKVELGIFDQNVRVYLKSRNRINKRIIESALSETNHMFWYQNNGITMTCDKLDIGPSRRAPKITLNNVQIVNGGQTSNCLFEAAREDSSKVDDVLLLVRIIETSDEDVKLAIAESTNSQTPINVRDLRSNDRQQRQLEDAFADMGLYYERKAGQHASETAEDRIDALSAGQAYLAYGVGLPETAKKDRGRVFGDLYETVFTEDLTAQKLLTSFRLGKLLNDRKRLVRSKIRNDTPLKQGEMAIIDGLFHMLFAVRQICQREGLDQWDMEASAERLDDAVKYVEEIFLKAQSEDINFSSNRFFKDAKTKDGVTRIVG